MDKPVSMSVKDYLIKVMAVRTNTPSSIIEAVINNQFEQASIALKNNNSVELSGFGKFLFKNKAAKKKMEKMLSKIEVFDRLSKSEDNSLQKRESFKNKLNNTIKDMEVLKTKLDGFCKDNRGIQE